MEIGIEGTNFITYVCGGMVVIFMLFLGTGIRILPEYRRLAVYRLGRFIGKKGPGLVYLMPIVDRGVSIDLRKEESKAKSSQYTMFGVNGETKTSVNTDGGNVKVENSFQKNLAEIFKRIKIFMSPDFDLGVKNVRIRGVIRIMMGILLTAMFVFLTIGGAYIHDRLDFSRLENEPGSSGIYSFLLIVLPGLSTIFASMQVLLGIVELITNKSWNQISSSIRLLLILFVGVPLGVLLIASIIYLASKILDSARYFL